VCVCVCIYIYIYIYNIWYQMVNVKQCSVSNANCPMDPKFYN